MIKNLFLFAIVAVFFAACNNATTETGDQSATTDQQEIVTITTIDFNAHPENYVGKEVLIEGTAVHICKHGGKRMFIIGYTNDIIGDTTDIIGDTNGIIGDTNDIISDTHDIIDDTTDSIGNTSDVERIQIKAGDQIDAFNVELEGSKVSIIGVVDELRIDEAYLTEWENELKADNPESELKIHKGEEGHEHSEGDPNAEFNQIDAYRAQLAELGVDHLSFYSIIAKEYKEKK